MRSDGMTSLVFSMALALALVAQGCSAKSKYEVKACLVDAIGMACAPQPVGNLRYQTQPVSDDDCEDTVGLEGSLSFVDLTLPDSKVLFVQVTTAVPGQSSADGFFVRPTRLSQQWGEPILTGSDTASFYVAETGQFSVEFAASSIWRDYKEANTFDALMLFVNPEFSIPSSTTLIRPDTTLRTLGPNKAYRYGG